MKGVVFSTSFFIVIIVLFFNLSHYVHFEHNRAMINNKFKKSMIELAHKVREDKTINRDEILTTFELIIENQFPKDFDFEVGLLGYLDDPLLIRISLEGKSKVSPFTFTLEETIIEKGLSEDEGSED